MKAMSDPNMKDFYSRVGRIERAHALGFGFEADGTLGKSYYRRLPVKRRPAFRVGIFLLFVCFGLKGAIHYHLGEAGLADRVAQIEARGGFDAVQGFLMRPEPVTRFISSGINWAVTRVTG